MAISPAPPDAAIMMDKAVYAPGLGETADSACIPYGYVDDEPQRIASYRRVSECLTEDAARKLQDEFADRFGPPPDSVKRLFRLARLKIRAAALKIQRVEVKDGRLRIFRDATLLKPAPPPPADFGERTLDGQLDYLFRLLERGI